MKKKILSVLLFCFAILVFAEPWVFVNDLRIKTTIGHDSKHRMYICEWIDSEAAGVCLHVKTSGSFHFGRIRAGCVIVNDYVFPANLQDGFYDNSVLLRLNSRILEQIEQDCSVIIKIDGYTVYSEFNSTRGEEYE